MTILIWELLPLTKCRRASFLLSATLICIFLASSVRQSRGLTCYDCAFNPDNPDDDNPPLSKTCKEPDGTTPTADCNATSEYCVKKHVKIILIDDTSQQYMSRECSGAEPIPDLTGKTPPLCFAFTGFDLEKSANAPNATLKLREGTELKLQVNQTATIPEQVKESNGRICVCKGDKCNKGVGEMITEADGTNIDPTTTETTPPTPPAPEVEAVAGGSGLVLFSPSLYFLPLFLASTGVLCSIIISACAIPTSASASASANI